MDLVRKGLNDDDYRALQDHSTGPTRTGLVIPGSGGLRRIRWSAVGRGKRGGIRVIYFWDKASSTCYMLFLYRKNEQGDLPATQTRDLARLVREEFE